MELALEKWQHLQIAVNRFQACDLTFPMVKNQYMIGANAKAREKAHHQFPNLNTISQALLELRLDLFAVVVEMNEGGDKKEQETESKEQNRANNEVFLTHCILSWAMGAAE